MLKMSWCRPSEREIQEAQASGYQLTSNGCALTIKKGMKQRFNHITAKLIKCNVDNEYDSSSAVKRAPECKRIEKNKREAKQQKRTAFILN